MKYRLLFIATLLLASVGLTQAQSKEENWGSWGNSHPSPILDTNTCGEYYWPQSPCPEVQIKQKHDHTPIAPYRHEGWDTAITCPTRESGIILSCMPYIPVKYFNGYYSVDEIPFDPPDTTFHFGTQLPNNNDDAFCANAVQLAYNFYFFGEQKNAFVAGGNGIITFNTSSAGQHCDYGNYIAIPWSAENGGGNYGNDYPTVAYHRNAIYGVFQDTDPGGNMTNPQGIWYGIKDEWPCRKIIASYNDLPWYPHGSNTTNRQKYQIVCYEGSNIIEVHVARRTNASCSWCSYGLIGIQNATGQPQVKGSLSSTTREVIPNAPAAFWPTGKNPMTTQTIINTAYRFTPWGNTPKNYEWFFIREDGDTIRLTTDNTDTNGYYIPVDDQIPTTGLHEYPNCPTLTRAIVKPTVPTQYYFHMWFNDANEVRYDLFDSIFVGIDTANDMTLHVTERPANQKIYDICEGSAANLKLEYPATQLRDTVTYRVERISNGERIVLDGTQSLTIGEWNDGNTTHTQNITLGASLPSQGRLQNKIDSIYITTYIEFASHCTNYDTLLVRVFPNFDTTVVVGICQGESYLWSANGKTYTTSTRADEELQSVPGCDSIVHLDLTVMDVSYTIDTVKDCKPYTWLNGTTYYASNSATAATDTLMMKNIWDCDSIVQLNFTLLPVEARIRSDREFFDYDHLDAQLNDISLNNSTRTWIVPGGNTSTSATLYYSIQPDMDEANIWLVATSPYGCIDTTDIVIPMRKESFWMPNAFMPDNAAGNNTFGSMSLQTAWEEMSIYNRHGILVFQCEGADCQWDGKDLNGNPSPQGVYTYIIRYSNEYKPKQIHVLRGTVTLIR